MAALVAAIHVLFCYRRKTHKKWYDRCEPDMRANMRGGSVYIMTNRPNGILYIGVTSDLGGRIYEHREGLYPGFTKRYGLKRLVWHDEFDTIEAAIQHEKTMKHWPRAWKVRTIMAMNPDWKDRGLLALTAASTQLRVIERR